MSIFARTEGNVLVPPTQRMVNTKNGQQRITELRVMSDVWKAGANEGELVQDNEKSKPVGVTIWSERLGQVVFEQIRVGMRVSMEGDLYLHDWSETNAAGEIKSGHELRCTAEDVTLKLNRVEQIVMRARRSDATPAQTAAEPA